MSIKGIVANDYFEWLSDIVCGTRYSKTISHRKLLMLLHSTVFRYCIRNDENRAEDGLSMRYRFAQTQGDDSIRKCLDGPCSILEMMVALSIKIEENIMDDPQIGDRTGQWFWGMIVSLGLGSMSDGRFDKGYAIDILNRFMDRDYQPNGKGSLFTLRHCDKDVRDVEIWYQMCWYMDELLGL